MLCLHCTGAASCRIPGLRVLCSQQQHTWRQVLLLDPPAASSLFQQRPEHLPFRRGMYRLKLPQVFAASSFIGSIRPKYLQPCHTGHLPSTAYQCCHQSGSAPCPVPSHQPARQSHNGGGVRVHKMRVCVCACVSVCVCAPACEAEPQWGWHARVLGVCLCACVGMQGQGPTPKA